MVTFFSRYFSFTFFDKCVLFQVCHCFSLRWICIDLIVSVSFTAVSLFILVPQCHSLDLLFLAPGISLLLPVVALFIFRCATNAKYGGCALSQESQLIFVVNHCFLRYFMLLPVGCSLPFNLLLTMVSLLFFLLSQYLSLLCLNLVP